MAENIFLKWHGIDKKTIEWGPTIDPNKCTGCGLCVVTCGEKRNVFGYDVDTNKAVVLFKDNCMVGCNNCQIACLWNAISFPEQEYVRRLAKKIPQEILSKEIETKLLSDPDLNLDKVDK